MADPSSTATGGVTASSHQNAALLISTYMNSIQGTNNSVTSPVHHHYPQTSNYAGQSAQYTGTTNAGISNSHNVRGDSQEPPNPHSRGGSTTPKPGQ